MRKFKSIKRGVGLFTFFLTLVLFYENCGKIGFVNTKQTSLVVDPDPLCAKPPCFTPVVPGDFKVEAPVVLNLKAIDHRLGKINILTDDGNQNGEFARIDLKNWTNNAIKQYRVFQGHGCNSTAQNQQSLSGELAEEREKSEWKDYKALKALKDRNEDGWKVSYRIFETSNGEKQFSVRFKDDLDKFSDCQNISVFLDKTAPQVNLNEQSIGRQAFGGTYYFRLEEQSDALGKFTFSAVDDELISGREFESGIDESSHSRSLTRLDDNVAINGLVINKRIKLSQSSKDLAGNANFASANLAIDTLKPTIFLTETKDRVTVKNDDAVLNFRLEDNFFVVDVRCKLGEFILNCNLREGTNNVVGQIKTNQLPDLVDGTHRISIWATDAAGNTEQKEHSFVLNLRNPNALIFAGISGGSDTSVDSLYTNVANDDVKLNFTLPASGDAIVSVTSEIKNGNDPVCQFSSINPANLILNQLCPAIKEHSAVSVVLTGCDAQGECKSSNPTQITIDLGTQLLEEVNLAKESEGKFYFYLKDVKSQAREAIDSYRCTLGQLNDLCSLTNLNGYKYLVLIKPNNLAVGSHNISLSAVDAAGHSDTTEKTITVMPTETAPCDNAETLPRSNQVVCSLLTDDFDNRSKIDDSDFKWAKVFSDSDQIDIRIIEKDNRMITENATGWRIKDEQKIPNSDATTTVKSIYNINRENGVVAFHGRPGGSVHELFLKSQPLSLKAKQNGVDRNLDQVKIKIKHLRQVKKTKAGSDLVVLSKNNFSYMEGLRVKACFFNSQDRQSKLNCLNDDNSFNLDKYYSTSGSGYRSLSSYNEGDRIKERFIDGALSASNESTANINDLTPFEEDEVTFSLAGINQSNLDSMILLLSVIVDEGFTLRNPLLSNTHCDNRYPFFAPSTCLYASPGIDGFTKGQGLLGTSSVYKYMYSTINTENVLFPRIDDLILIDKIEVLGIVNSVND